MRLRKQLLIVSLAALILPWAGVQYLRAIEQVLRSGQQEALQATANAIAAVIRADESARHALSAFTYTALADARPVVAQAVNVTMVLDGYRDDWDSQETFSDPLQPLPDSTLRGTLSAGVLGSQVFMLVNVQDRSRQFYNPSRPLQQADFVRLALPALDGVVNFYTAAPGRVQVQVVSNRQNVHFPIQGVWYEHSGGYQLELVLPLPLVQQGVQVQVFDGLEQQPALHNAPQPLPFIYSPVKLQHALAAFDKPSERIYLTSARGFLLASTGSLYAPAGSPHPLLRSLVDWLLDVPSLADWQDPLHQGRFALGEQTPLAFAESLSATSALNYSGERIYRVSAPVHNAEGQSLGVVVVEKNATAINAMITGATGRLVVYSLLAFLLVGLVCIAYASWLSFRIRRLNKQVESALDSRGRIHTLTQTRFAKDEVGELGKSYSVLLARLQEYTEYLQMLGSKLSHELRTPLAVIKSSMENLLHQPLPSEAQTYAQRALTGAERLSNILTAMTAANRLEQSLQYAETEVVDLKELLEELTEAYADIYSANPVVFLCAETSVRWRCNAAPELLVQMMDKLVENAVDFSPSGAEIKIVLERSKKEQGKKWLLIKVINPGSQLPEAMHQQIFDSLVSMRPEDQQGRHFGLGLYIVKIIARFHGGEVRAFNAEGGVVFEVALPEYEI